MCFESLLGRAGIYRALFFVVPLMQRVTKFNVIMTYQAVVIGLVI
jgi:hypothetical protein